MDWASLFRHFILNLIITALAYLLVPAIIAISGEKYSDKKLKRIIIVNCILVWIFFRIFQTALGDEPSSIAVVLLWGGIGYWMLIECNLKAEQPSHTSASQPNMHTSLSNSVRLAETTSEASAQTNEVPATHSITHTVKQKVRYCSRCGNVIDPDTKKCTGCGKQYFKGFRLSTILLTLTLILSLAGNYLLYAKNIELEIEVTNLEQTHKDLELEKSNLANTVRNLKKDKASLQVQIYEYSSKTDFYDKYIVFVVEGDKKYYHHYDCDKFQSCDSFRAYNINAVEDKYKPCSLCCD